VPGCRGCEKGMHLCEVLINDKGDPMKACRHCHEGQAVCDKATDALFLLDPRGGVDVQPNAPPALELDLAKVHTIRQRMSAEWPDAAVPTIKREPTTLKTGNTRVPRKAATTTRGGGGSRPKKRTAQTAGLDEPTFTPEIAAALDQLRSRLFPDLAQFLTSPASNAHTAALAHTQHFLETWDDHTEEERRDELRNSHTLATTMNGSALPPDFVAGLLKALDAIADGVQDLRTDIGDGLVPAMARVYESVGTGGGPREITPPDSITSLTTPANKRARIAGQSRRMITSAERVLTDSSEDAAGPVLSDKRRGKQRQHD
jgi:hypothetical protein